MDLFEEMLHKNIILTTERQLILTYILYFPLINVLSYMVFLDKVFNEAENKARPSGIKEVKIDKIAEN